MKVRKPLLSVTIQTSDRAGRAPYNFVPLPGESFKEAQPPPSADAFLRDANTGVIEFTVTALTDFYTRGMWTEAEYRNQAREDSQPLPYMVDGKVRIPGSSLRGMIRSLVEILSFSPIGEINDTQMFFRAVASSPNPGDGRSFEPQAKIYKNRLLDPRQNLLVCAGYLYGSRDAWRIQPASLDPVSGLSWYRYTSRETWQRRAVRFDPSRDGDFADVNPRGSEEGWLVCSGDIPGKRKQWVIRAEDPDAPRLPIPAALVASYKENGASKKIRAAHFEYMDSSDAVPCFYVLDDAGTICAFGHTAFMRMPYTRTPRQAIPAHTRKQPYQWSFTERLFGRLIPAAEPGAAAAAGAKGRVFFEDALLIEDKGIAERRRVILGQPQPTTYQHYLVQTDENVDKSLHWDGDLNGQGQACIRGHKLYWHRPNAPMPAGSEETKKDNVATEFHPVRLGTSWRARIRFENLDDAELGAIISAIALPPQCAHKLGMAKPLGLGSVQIGEIRVRTRKIEERYASFLATRESLRTGEKALPVPELLAKQNTFAAWVLGPEAEIGHLWTHPRIAELRALLTLTERQRTSDWLNKTRYLEFGRPATYNSGRNYNEYLEVGHSDRPPRSSKRRPLPPAKQVLNDNGFLPADPRPDFK